MRKARRSGLSLLPFAAHALPNRTKPQLALPRRTSPRPATTAHESGGEGPEDPPRHRQWPMPCPGVPSQAEPHGVMPCHTTASPAATGFFRTQRRGPKPSALRSSALALPCRAISRRALLYHCRPDHAPPHLGLTPNGCPAHQPTSAKRLLRLSTTGTTSASKRPCFGRQSPMPTSLPASTAISSMSR